MQAVPVLILLSAILGLPLLFLLLRAVWEPTTLDVTEIDMSHFVSPESDQTVLRVLLFSDIHAEHLRISNQKILKAMIDARPDILLFAGDLAAKQHALPRAIALMKQIRCHPSLAGLPFFAVSGNHDTADARSGLENLGIDVLINETRVFDWHGKSWLLIGLDDLRHGSSDYRQVLAQAASRSIPVSRRIILAHNPDSLFRLATTQADWFMAGHFHGGQIWAPFQLEFRLFRTEKLPLSGFYKGAQRRQNMNVYISRGLGCVTLPLRLFSKPELTLFHISG